MPSRRRPAPPMAETFPEVSETQAQGETAAIYADIRATLQTPLVNMIWRALAAVPGALPWAWGSVAPLHRSGLAGRAAASLRRSLMRVEIAPITVQALRAKGVDEAAERQIRRTIASYAHANLLNAVTFAALKVMPEGVEAVPPARTVADDQQDPPQQGEELPALLALSAMAPHTAEQVRKVSRLGCEAGVAQVQVSLPRQLAHWPGFLELWLAAFATSQGDGTLREAAVGAMNAIGEHGRVLARRAPALASPLAPADSARVRAIIDAIVPEPIGRLLVVIEGLQEAMREGQVHPKKSGAEERT